LGAAFFPGAAELIKPGMIVRTQCYVVSMPGGWVSRQACMLKWDGWISLSSSLSLHQSWLPAQATHQASEVPGAAGGLVLRLDILLSSSVSRSTTSPRPSSPSTPVAPRSFHIISAHPSDPSQARPVE
jgi:hypothetical protein